MGHSSRSSFHHIAFFPSLKQNFIAYRSSKFSDCIFEIHQLFQSGFNRVYSNSSCSSWFEAEIIKNGQSSYKMYINNILNFQESTTITYACKKKVWKYIYIYYSSIWYSLSHLVGLWQTKCTMIWRVLNIYGRPII